MKKLVQCMAIVGALSAFACGDNKAGGGDMAASGGAATPAPTPMPTPAASQPAGGGTAMAGGAAAMDPAAEAAQIFNTRCATCHGADGKGTGPAAAALNPKPRDYSDAAWQKATTDDLIAKVILEGGASVGKSPLMAPNPDLKDKPAVVKELVAKIRSFAGGGGMGAAGGMGGAAPAPAAPAPATK